MAIPYGAPITGKETRTSNISRNSFPCLSANGRVFSRHRCAGLDSHEISLLTESCDRQGVVGVKSQEGCFANRKRLKHDRNILEFEV